MIKIKDEYLDLDIMCPLTRQTVNCRFIPIELYDYYNNHGYNDIFEEEITETETNDLPINGDEHNNADPSGEDDK